MKQSRIDIQALRGLAVLLVVFYHAKILPLSAGYLGVDIFFVISGFLITGLVKSSIEAGNFRFSQFYFRRAKRLLPAAYVTFLVCALVAPVVLVSNELNDFASQMIGAITFTGNIVLWQQTGYFQGAGDLKPFLHIWSLAIEEQYYFILPATLVFVAPRRWLPLAAVILFSSLLLCVVGGYFKPIATFYLLPTRCWELAIGSVGALIARNSGLYRLAKPLFIPALIALLALPFFPFGGNHPGIDAFIICLATFIVILCHHPRLNCGPLAYGFAWVGNFSYSLYLVHWPIFSFANNAWVGGPTGLPLFEIRMIALLLSLVLGYLLYRYVEIPAREFNLQMSRLVLLRTIAASFGLVFMTSSIVRAMSSAEDMAHARRFVVGFDTTCQFGSHFSPKHECRNSDNPSILIWGDSFAMHLVPGIASSSGSRGVVQATRALCGPLLGIAPISLNLRSEGELLTRVGAEDCIKFNQSVIDYLAASPSVQIVVLSSYFQQYLEQIEYQNLRQNGTDITVIDASTDAALEAMRQTVHAVRALGKRIVVVAPPPSAEFNTAICLERLADGKLLLGAPPACEVPVIAYHRVRSRLLGFLALLPKDVDVDVIDFDDFLCNSVSCKTMLDGAAIYRDAGHLSYKGSQILAEQIALVGKLESLAR